MLPILADLPLITRDKIETLEAALLQLPQVDLPLTHRFAPGVYLREIFMPAGAFVIGHCHKTQHFNIVSQGRATVMMDGKVHEIRAPCAFVSEVDVRKVLYIHEDMIWATVHPSHETDLAILEDLLITKSASYVKHIEDLQALKRLVHEDLL